MSDDTCDLLCLDLPKAEALRERRIPVELAEAAAARAKALGDPTRLTLAVALRDSEGELCVCDLAWVAERSEKLVSHHVRVLRSALREGGGAEAMPREFAIDATKQYVLNEYETHYARPIAMYANLLPPIGFTGTTIGILMRLVALNFSNQALQLGSLATALVVTVLALVGFASLEAVKVLLQPNSGA